MQGRLRDMLQWSKLGHTTVSQRDGSDGPLLIAALDTAMALAVFQSDTLRARRVVRQALERIPIESLPAADRPWGYLAWLSRFSRDPEIARMAYQGWVRDTATAGATPGMSQHLQAEVAFASGRPEEAITWLREADRHLLNNERTYYADVGYAFDLAGNVDSALVYYERFLERRFTDSEIDPNYVNGIHKRLAELYDGKGDVERAISNYQAFADLWKNADPELQPMVQRARARAAELSRRRG